MERLTVAEVIRINKELGEGGVQINNNLSGIIYGLEYVNNKKDYATKLICDIINLHPFMEGNKRTAFYALVMFLEKNKFMLRKEYKYNDKIDRIIGHIINGRSANHTKQLLKKMIVNENERIRL
jgi:prophage maintenance system killer protein